MVATLALPLAAAAQTSDEDPFESFNRAVFSFNDTADTYVLRPIAKGYRAVTPDPVEKAVARVFSNLGEINSVANSLLQGKFDKAGRHTSRFLINTTLGIGGILDVAEPAGLPKLDGEDFGQTLATWGVDSGPYLVLPLLGSSTVRDTPTRYVDSLLDPVFEVDHVPTRNTILGAEALSGRAELLQAEKLISGDKYIFTREVYLQRRAYLINDGAFVDDFDDAYEDFDDLDWGGESAD